MITLELPKRFEDRTVLTKEEFAGVIGISVRELEYWIEEGRIIVKRWGYKTIRIPVSELKKL